MKTTTRLQTGASARFVSAEGSSSLPTILIVHGWKSSDPLAPTSSYVQLQEMFARAGYHSLLVVLRGHLGAAGDIDTMSREDHIADVEAAITWLRERTEVDASRLCGCGTSYGAYILAVSSICPTLRLITFTVPALYPDKGWDEPAIATVDWTGLQNWRKSFRTPEECRALRNISEFKGHFIEFVSEFDEFMPRTVALSYASAAKRATSVTIWTMSGARHVFTETQGELFLRELEKWLIEHYPSLP